MNISIFGQQANSVTERVLQEIKIDDQNIRFKIKSTEAKIFNVLKYIVDKQPVMMKMLHHL